MAWFTGFPTSAKSASGKKGDLCIRLHRDKMLIHFLLLYLPQWTTTSSQTKLHSTQFIYHYLWQIPAKSWSEIILQSGMKYWIFPVEVKLFACLTFLNEQKNQQCNKRIVYSPNKHILVILLTKLMAGLLFYKIFFLQWHTIFNSIPLTSEQSIWTQFFGPCSLFPLEFLFYFGISLGVLFSNFVPFCSNKKKIYSYLK